MPRELCYDEGDRSRSARSKQAKFEFAHFIDLDPAHETGCRRPLTTIQIWNLCDDRGAIAIESEEAL
jgi:hypothetical protein